LKQWVCDVCGQVIGSPKDGYVVWKKDGLNNTHFAYRIYHKVICDNDDSFNYSSSLEDFLGEAGLAKLLTMIDAGKMHQPLYREQISNIRDFLEFFRRVQLPYYEEARLYWQDAIDDDYFADGNELWTYLPQNLKALIKLYGAKST
jgi:hypothetical protein